jgi:hypothetical protein
MPLQAEPDTDSDHDSQPFDRASPAESARAVDDTVDCPTATLDESGRRLFNLAIECIVSMPPVEAYEVGDAYIARVTILNYRRTANSARGFFGRLNIYLGAWTAYRTLTACFNRSCWHSLTSSELPCVCHYIYLLSRMLSQPFQCKPRS